MLMPFFRYDDISGTAFEESPLVKQKYYYMSGVGLFYLFY